MRYQITKTNNSWKVSPYKSGDFWKVEHLPTSDTHIVNIHLIRVGDADEESLLILALEHGIKIINHHIKSAQWRKDFGQI